MHFFKSCMLCFIVLSAMSVAVRAQDGSLEPLSRRVGRWVNERYEKKAEWTPKERTTTGEQNFKLVLDKNFIQGDLINKDGSKGHSLMTYDTDAKVYRWWFFGNKREFIKGGAVGRWDPKTERMDWKWEYGDGLRGKMTWQFTGKDKMEWELTILDGSGKLMLHNGGTQTRKK